MIATYDINLVFLVEIFALGAALFLVSRHFQRHLRGKAAKAETLGDSEERFRALVQNSSDIITILEADGNIRYKSPSVEQIAGYKPEELVGKNVFDDLHPEDIPEVRAALAQLIQKPGVLVSIECRFRHANGSWIFLESVCNNLLNDANIKGVIVNSRDITQRKQLEAIALSRKQESDFLENASIGLHWVGADGRIIWTNQAELKLLGYTSKEYIGQHIAKFHADKEVIDDILQRLTANETLHNYEARLLCKDGSIKHVLINSNVFWKDDQFIHTRCFTRDITERKQTQEALQKAHDELEVRVEKRATELKNANEQLQGEIIERQRAEEAMRKSQQMLQLVMDNIPQFIYWKDKNSVYLGCNRNFAQLAGIGNPENIVGKTDYDLAWQKEKAEFFHECDRRVMETDTPKYHMVETLLGTDGQQVWLGTNKIPLHDLEGNVVGILGTFADITKRKQDEEALSESQRKLATLIDSLPGIVFSCANDPEWSMTCLSEGCFNLTGYTSEELLKNGAVPYNSIIHAQDLQNVLKAIETAIALKQPYVVEYQIHTKSGEKKWVWEKGTGIFDSNGEVLSLEGFIIDITERQRAEAALRESKKRLQDHNTVLMELARRKTLSLGDLNTAVQEITEAATNTLGTERVSVWLYNEARSKIQCIDLYEWSKSLHSKGIELAAAN